MYMTKYYYELDNEISPEMVKELVANTNINIILGLPMF